MSEETEEDETHRIIFGLNLNMGTIELWITQLIDEVRRLKIIIPPDIKYVESVLVAVELLKLIERKKETGVTNDDVTELMGEICKAELNYS